jgi:hypothetical protein
MPTGQPADVISAVAHPTTAPKKTIELTLAYYVHAYKVTGIKNSTYYQPGQWMTREVAQQCCDIPNWTVTMVDNDIIQSLTNFGVSTALGKMV